jgi:hypothetical protein
MVARASDAGYEVSASRKELKCPIVANRTLSLARPSRKSYLEGVFRS